MIDAPTDPMELARLTGIVQAVAALRPRDRKAALVRITKDLHAAGDIDMARQVWERVDVIETGQAFSRIIAGADLEDHDQDTTGDA